VEISRIDCQYVEFDADATYADGTVAVIGGVDVAVLPPRRTPTADTVWSAATFASGVATLLVAGPEADVTGALVIPLGGADLWARVSDSPEVTTRRVTRINVV
jgi:hypothetical protein